MESGEGNGLGTRSPVVLKSSLNLAVICKPNSIIHEKICKSYTKSGDAEVLFLRIRGDWSGIDRLICLRITEHWQLFGPLF